MNALDTTTAAPSAETRENLLVKAIAEYQTKLESGDPPDRDAFLIRFPEIAQDLADCLDNLDFLRNIAPQINDPASPDSVGQDSSTPVAVHQMGDFRILREVGRGGMGVVYEAEQVSMARRVALKVLPFAAVLDQKVLQRFRSEAQVAGQLVHQNIVPVYSVGCERSVHYYAMQYIEGMTLAELILELKESGVESRESIVESSESGDRRNLSPSKIGSSKSDFDTSPIAALSTAHSNHDAAYIRSAANLMIQVARALEYAHDQGVIHRDIKPSNLMVDGQGKIWVTDFGLAHVETGPSVTITGDFLGTLRYMSPEQALAQRVVVDHRTDIYSLGLTFYELLTQRPAFTGTDRQELLRQISFEEPPRPRRLNKAISTDLETILLKTIEKNPAERYATAAEFADDLGRFIEDRPIHARRPTGVQTASKWCRRHKSLVAATLISFFVLLLFIAIGSSLLAVQLNNLAEQEQQVANKERAARLDIERANNHLARTLARSFADKAQTFCETGEIAMGMLWLAHSLDVAPDDADVLRRGIRSSLAAWRPRLTTLSSVFEDNQGVYSAALNADGTRVVTGSGDGRIRLWDAASAEKIAERAGHPRWGPETEDDLDRRAQVTMVSFSPDGSRILSAARDHTARIWDAKTLEPIGSPLQHPRSTEPADSGSSDGHVRCAVFSPDGQRIATCGEVGAQIWDAQTGKHLGSPLRHPSNSVIRSVAFSPNGLQLATGGYDAMLMVWDLETQYPIAGPLKVGVSVLDYSLDGSRLIVGNGSTGQITYYNAGTLEPEPGFMQHGKGVRDVQVSGARMASGGFDMTARIWDVDTRASIGQPLRHLESVRSISISRDESRILAASELGTARLWTIGKTNPNATKLDTTHHASVAFSQDGTFFVAGKQVWETATIRPISDIPIAGTPSCVSFGATGIGESRVAFSSGNHVEIQDARTLMPCGKSLPHPRTVRAISFALDGGHVATSCKDGFLRIWDLDSRTATISPYHNGYPVDIASSPDGSWIVTVGWDKLASFWDASTLELIGEPIQCSSLVVGVAISPDSTRIATALANGIGHVWSVKDRITIGTPMQHENGITAVDFSPDGTLVVSVGLDEKVKFWDADTGQPVGPPLLNEGIVHDVAYHPLGSHVLVKNRLWPAPPRRVEGSDERIRLWTEVITGMELDMDVGGVITVLDGPTWRSRQAQLEELGGPPAR